MHNRPALRYLFTLLALLLLASTAYARPSLSQNEKATIAFFETIKDSPPMLRGVLQSMPKGANLHGHLTGEVYAEDYIKWAAQDGLCVHNSTYTLSSPIKDACAKNTQPAANALQNQQLYNNIVNAFSMRNLNPPLPMARHDDSFRTFGLFSPAAQSHARLLAKAIENYELDNVGHVEVMHSFFPAKLYTLAPQVGWNGDAKSTYDELTKAGLFDKIPATRKEIANTFTQTEKLLGKRLPISVKIINQVTRTLDPATVFAQIAYSFELIRQDSAVVAFNLVAPESSYVARRDYALHMGMIDTLYKMPAYKNTNITLHAGELTLGHVPPRDLKNHIWLAINKGHAKRIGHGVDVMYEKAPFKLLHTMRTSGIGVEICLTSNAKTLGVSGKEHPLPVYAKFGVPVSLNTDYAGVSRSDLTQEYVRAVTEFDLGYKDLKNISRSSLDQSFLEGKSLWSTTPTLNGSFDLDIECRDSLIGHETATCQKLMRESPKAKLQWELEKQFTEFERHIAKTFSTD